MPDCGFVMSTHLGMPQIVCNKESGHVGDHAMTFPAQYYPPTSYNRDEVKRLEREIEDTGDNRFVAHKIGGVAAPLEGTPKVEQFWEQWVQTDDGKHAYRNEPMFRCRMRFAEAYAAAVSKNLREELAATVKLYYETEAKWVQEVLTVSNEIRQAQARISELEQELRKLIGQN